MKGNRILLFMGAVGLVSAWGVFGVDAAQKKPVYVGVQVCAGCHAASGMGDQYSKWLHSKHSQAYAVLARPDSYEIAKLSGLRTVPQESAICLGCHGTAWHAEDWQKDETFHIEEGVQCEGCHGPGSEYASAEVMKNRQAAMMAGLQMPSQDSCMNCHLEKGSHVAVLKRAPVEMKAGWESLLHPLPPNPMMASSAVASTAPQKPGRQFVGAMACGKCHRGEMMGHQWSIWRTSAHADAWAVLGTAKGREIAHSKGIEDPQNSVECLKCHSDAIAGEQQTGLQRQEGVGCEGCHGAGSDYAVEAVMRDKPAAMTAGLRHVSRETCIRCHQEGHGKAFDFDAAMNKIYHPTRRPVVAGDPPYKTPLRLALRPGHSEIYVTCESSNSVIVVDTVHRNKLTEIAVGGNPTGIAFSPDGKHAFVTNRLDDTVSVIDGDLHKVVAAIKVGNEPHGLLTDGSGKLLYVLNTSSNDISVIDLVSLRRIKNLSASNGPWSIAMSPDGKHLFVTNMKSRFAAMRQPFASEMTVIAAESGTVEKRVVVPGANLMMGVAWHPSGAFALATLNRTKGALPMTRLLQGWTITNGLGIIRNDGTVDEVLLDESDMGFADATDVAFTADGRFALVTSSGTDRVAVVDVTKLLSRIHRSSPYEREHILPNHLGFPTEYISKQIPTGKSPRGIVTTSREAFIANSLDDTIGIIDLATMKPAGTIDLGGPKTISKQRWGEQLFHNAFVTFHRQYSCNSCHPDGHVDGMTYDIEADGIGIEPVDNRTLRGILDTAPFKWEGTNPSLSRQCGARLAVFFTRLAPFTPEQLAAVDYYVTTIPRPPNWYRPLGATLTPAQRRGKEFFDRAMTNDGRMIPMENRCSTCHFPPYYTDRKRHDVGTKVPFDRTGNFDVPHLNNIYDSAPYLHNGMAATLEEIWTVYNPEDRHGVTNDMTKDQLNDLVEYLKTL